MPRAAFCGALLLLALFLCSCGEEESAREPSTLATVVETEDQNFVDWSRLAGIPIESIDPGEEFDGLSALGAMVGDARIVAVGEPVYGAREFTLAKRRMLAYLVENKGINTVVAEVGWSESLAVENYLQTGEGDPATLLASLRSWTWNTVDALDLIKWMRRHNLRAAPSKQFHFYGCDMLYTSAAARALGSYLERVDPEFMVRVKETFDFLGEAENDGKYAKLRSRGGGALELDVERALDRLWRKRRLYMGNTSTVEWEDSEHHGRVLRQSVSFWRASKHGKSLGSARQRFLADNIRWILDRGDGSRVFLWSHNRNVSVEAMQDGEMIGRQLQRMVGPDLVVIGMLFNQGSFRAKSGSAGVAEVRIGPAPVGSVENSLAKVGSEMLLLDLRQSTDLVDQWLESERYTREAGLKYSDPNSMLRNCILGRRFDLIMWIDTTNASSLTTAWGRAGL